MHSREQYLAALREEYLRGNKKRKTRLLNEARKRTRLNRKVLIRKLARVPAAAPRGALRCGSDNAAGAGLERLRASGGLKCSQQVADMLTGISPKRIDRLLAHEKSVRCLKQLRRPPVHPPCRQGYRGLARFSFKFRTSGSRLLPCAQAIREGSASVSES